MPARYLVRFDDICPTMNWAAWSRIETVLDRHGVAPILAVVPDNRDPKLMVDNSRADFWARVRGWQTKGWTIALHGFQHLYETQNGGLMKINRYSEFAGLERSVQRHKLEAALAICQSQGVRPDCWVAPGHAFDATTVELLCELGIRVVSDGFHLFPVQRLGALWVPQQLWRFRPMPFGVWTVCYHHNGFNDAELRRFENDIATYAARISSLSALQQQGTARPYGWSDAVFSATWLLSLRLKRRAAA